MHADLLGNLASLGYDEMTPIQAKSLPDILAGVDVIAQGKTGSGKTAAFGLGLLQRLDVQCLCVQALVLCPTRELADQVAKEMRRLARSIPNIKVLTLCGGVPFGPQVGSLEYGAHIIVGTPGRIEDHLGKGTLKLDRLMVLVLDEADRMLDMGFIPDIEKIVSLLSPIRQTLLFSATMQPEIKKLTEQFLSNPREVSVTAPASTAANVEQFLVWTTRRNKREALLEIIKSEDVKNAFVFCNRKRDIADLTSWLKSKGYSVGQMHGDMDQKTRTETLQAFKNDEITLLVCSDVAARGLDVAGLSHVFNYDVPFNNDDYVHRIGRTGRAGLDGRAWSLASKGDDEKFVDAIEKLIKRSIPVKQVGGEKSQERSNDRANDRSNERKAEQKPRREKKDSLPRQKAEAPKQNKNQSKPSKKNDDDASYQKGFGDDVPAFFG